MSLFVIALLLGAAGCAETKPALAAEEGPIPVEIRTVDGGYQLLRGGLPYQVKGAGAGVDAPDALAMLQALRQRGGNSVRTWNIGDGSYLDMAQEQGLSVALCLDIARERHGFDYSDPAAVARQFAHARQQVLKHRDHPALLAWVIGNELNHDYKDPRVYDAVNAISKMIHELDPNHPTTTTTANIDSSLAKVLTQRAPDLDFISIQVYGSLVDLPSKLADIELNKPVMVTEWGTIGHWEVPVTSWGAPLELDSSKKADAYFHGFSQVLPKLGRQLIGDYAFLWGQKQERTPTWYGVFVDGRATAAVDTLQRYWTGDWPVDRAPDVVTLTLDGREAGKDVKLPAGGQFTAKAEIVDAQTPALSYRWKVLEESRAQQSGGDAEEVPRDRSDMLLSVQGASVTLQTPQVPGAYRLFVYAEDANNAVAHANLPFLVTTSAIDQGGD